MAQMILFFAVLFGVAGYTIHDVSKGINEGDGVNEAGGTNEGQGVNG